MDEGAPSTLQITHIHLVGGGSQPQMPYFLSSLWPSYTLLDKSSLENYPTDKVLHKRGVAEGVDSQYKAVFQSIRSL